MPEHDRGRRAEQEVSRVWDALARGAFQPTGTVNPTLLETMRRLGALGEQPRPDPDFANRLEAELTNRLSGASSTPSKPPHSVALLPAGRSALAGPRPTVWHEVSPVHCRWPTALTTVVLVLLVLVGSLIVLGPLRLTSHREEPTSIPAPGATLEIRLPHGVTAEDVLLQGSFEVLPLAAVWIDVERTVLDPGAVWSRGESQNNGEGPELYRIESGALTIETDGPIEVTRSGSQTPMHVDAGTDVVLNAGDMGFTPSGIRSHWRNNGATPTTILHGGISTSELGTFPHGVHRQQLIIDQRVTNPVAVPTIMTVRHLTLDVGASLSPEQVIGLQGLFVESGSLQVLVPRDQGTPEASFLLPEGASRTVGGHGYKRIPANWAMRNAGPGPVSLLIMTVSAANPLGTAPMG